jgi:hypothetical protein
MMPVNSAQKPTKTSAGIQCLREHTSTAPAASSGQHLQKCLIQTQVQARHELCTLLASADISHHMRTSRIL